MRLLLLAIFAIAVDGYKILVYSPKFAHSHSNFMGGIADTLVGAGHNVTTLIPCGVAAIADGTTESTVIHVAPEKETTAMFDRVLNGEFDPFEGSNFDTIPNIMQGRVFRQMFARMCHDTINKPGLMDRLRADVYDVFIAEPFDVCGLGMVPYIAPKSTILVSSSVLFTAMYDDLGIPKSLSFNPSLIMSSFDPHSMLDRFWNIVSEIISSATLPRSAVEAVLRERFGPSHPSTSTISSHAAVVFTNGEPLFKIAVPTLHKVVDIAGLGAKEPKALEKKWLDIMELRPRTVLISFGSAAKSSKLKPEAKRAILQTVAHFHDITFIWKYEHTDDDFAMHVASTHINLVLSTWTPQNDLLNHIRLSAFITHGGMGSVQETARRGVPAILLPLFGDQPRNALMLKERGLGKVLDKRDIRDSSKIIAALGEILSDDSYRLRAREMARKLAAKPFSAQELLVKHVEFAAEFGPSAALRPASIDISLVELYNLDLLLIASIVFSSAVFLVLQLVLLAVRRMVLKNKLE